MLGQQGAGEALAFASLDFQAVMAEVAHRQQDAMQAHTVDELDADERLAADEEAAIAFETMSKVRMHYHQPSYVMLCLVHHSILRHVAGSVQHLLTYCPWI